MEKQLKCWYNGNDTIFAYDEEDAIKVLDETCGVGYAQVEDEYEEKTDLEEEYSLYQEETKDGYLEPKNSTIVEEGECHRETRAKLIDWMNLIGRALLGSENY